MPLGVECGNLMAGEVRGTISPPLGDVWLGITRRYSHRLDYFD